MPVVATAAQSLSELTTSIVATHHTFLRNELPFLEERIAKMATNHGQDRPELFSIQQMLQDLRDDLFEHLMKEEDILFPYIVRLEAAVVRGSAKPHGCFPTIQAPIRMMLMEHDGATVLLANLRAASDNYTAPPGFCERGQEFYSRLEALDADLREHIRIENEVLFPRAIALEEKGQ
jgi:regulator of cell morphogenesis and NO signaling